MKAITARKAVLLLTVCLTLGVISAPIPLPKSGTLEDPANPAPLLRGADGKPVDMSKWPWKRDSVLERRALGDIPAQIPLIRREPEGPRANSDLKALGVQYIPFYEKRSEFSTTADALERRFWDLKARMGLEKRRASIQNDIERRWMLLDEWEELDRRLENFQHIIDEAIRGSGGYGKKPLKSRRPHDANSETTQGALCKLPGAHCGPTAAEPVAQAAPVPIERRDATTILEQRTLGLDDLERRLVDLEKMLNSAIEESGGHGKKDSKSRRPHDADSATTPGALLQLAAAQAGHKSGEPAPVAIERRGMLSDKWEELERRLADMQHIINEAIRQSGGTGKQQRKSSRPHDADSSTTQGALCKVPGAHCGPTTTPPSGSEPVPIERSFIPEDDLVPRDVGLDEYVEGIARRLLYIRGVIDGEAGALPALHGANPSFTFESALRGAVHPHGTTPPNAVGSEASFKDQLATATKERTDRAAKSGGES